VIKDKKEGGGIKKELPRMCNLQQCSRDIKRERVYPTIFRYNRIGYNFVGGFS
jgi:hypothetical protein